MGAVDEVVPRSQRVVEGVTKRRREHIGPELHRRAGHTGRQVFVHHHPPLGGREHEVRLLDARPQRERTFPLGRTRRRLHRVVARRQGPVDDAGFGVGAAPADDGADHVARGQHADVIAGSAEQIQVGARRRTERDGEVTHPGHGEAVVAGVAAGALRRTTTVPAPAAGAGHRPGHLSERLHRLGRRAGGQRRRMARPRRQ